MINILLSLFSTVNVLLSSSNEDFNPTFAYFVLFYLARFHKLYTPVAKIVFCLIEDNNCFSKLLFWFHSKKR